MRKSATAPFAITLRSALEPRLGFWPAFAIGVLLASTTIGAYFYIAGEK